MNALIGYRGNSLGNLSVTREQQLDANREITSGIRAKYAAAVRSTDTTKQTSESSDVSTAITNNNELGRDAFLQLLVLELQNQDPLEPVDNSQMIAQLAQFSSLEGMEKLNSNFEVLAGNVDQLNFISAQGLIGKFVEGVNDAGEIAVGRVDSVYLDGSIVVLNVEGEIVPMSNVLSISDSAGENDTEAGEEVNESTSGEKRGVVQKLGASINNFLDRF